MKIYTKTGDRGTTSLIGGTRVSKASVRLDSYGTADELNSYVGWLRAKVAAILETDLSVVDDKAQIDMVLRRTQNKLFNLGGYLALDQTKYQPTDATRVAPEEITYLEQQIDELTSQVEETHAFILPGGSEAISICHVCRTVARRLERRMVELYEDEKSRSHDDELSLQYVNRLSDYFFILSKKIAKIEKNALFLWEK